MVRTKVVDVENKLLREKLWLSPDDPTYTRIN